MSRRLLVAAAAFGMAAATGSAASGQAVQGPASERERVLLERLDSLESRTDSIRESRAMEQALREARARAVPTRTDTTRSRLATIVTVADRADEVHAIVELAEGRILERLPALADVTDRPLVRLYVTASGWSSDLERAHALELDAGGGSPSPDQLRALAVERVEGIILSENQRLPRQVSRWLTGQIIGAPPVDRLVYIELASSPAPAVQGCFTGETAACVRALGLADADGRPAFSPRARGDFLTYVAASEPNSLARLARRAAQVSAESSTVGQILRNVLDRPLAAAVDGWRSSVIESRPVREPPVRSAASTLLWILLLGGLATRSTRWRR